MNFITYAQFARASIISIVQAIFFWVFVSSIFIFLAKMSFVSSRVMKIVIAENTSGLWRKPATG